MKREQTKNKRGGSAASTAAVLRSLRPEDIKALADSSRNAAMANTSMPVEYGAVTLQPQVVRILQETMKDISLPAARTQIKTRAAKLTEREIKILEVIERGATGSKYCHELHDAKLRPRPGWIRSGCPGSYPKAVRDPGWRQKIQNEKSYVARKGRRIPG